MQSDNPTTPTDGVRDGEELPPYAAALFKMGMIIRQTCGKELGEKLMDQLDPIEAQLGQDIEADRKRVAAEVTKPFYDWLRSLECECDPEYWYGTCGRCTKLHELELQYPQLQAPIEPERS